MTMGQRPNKKKPAKLIVLSLLIYLVLFGSVYFYTTGKFSDLLSGFQLEKNDERIPKADLEDNPFDDIGKKPKEDELVSDGEDEEDENENETEEAESDVEEEISEGSKLNDKEFAAAQKAFEAQATMDDEKSDEELLAEIDYIKQLFFKDEDRTEVDLTTDRTLIGWIDVKASQIEDESLKRKVLSEKSALDSLVNYITMVQNDLHEESIDHVSAEKMRSYQRDINSMKSRDEHYGKIFEKEFKKLEEAYDRRN